MVHKAPTDVCPIVCRIVGEYRPTGRIINQCPVTGPGLTKRVKVTHGSQGIVLVGHGDS